MPNTNNVRSQTGGDGIDTGSDYLQEHAVTTENDANEQVNDATHRGGGKKRKSKRKRRR